MKRVFDFICSVVGLVVLSPLMLIIAWWIYREDRGPIFYRGERGGGHGKPFRIFKFRTMVLNAEHLGGGTTALNDPRITRVGKIIRKYKLDELPQLLNVIKGDMSIVGPRPELLRYTCQYGVEEQIILSVLPGLSDYSSIIFSSLDTHVGAFEADRAFERNVLPEKNRLRVKYVQEMSFYTDIMIVIKTLQVIWRKLNQKG
jgi:lipopolysaccharide/colanic/teichoic acid biosynthesis glycosyltransferase